MKSITIFAASTMSCAIGIGFSIGLLRDNWIPLFWLVALLVVGLLSNLVAGKQ